jgi:hypothetical protein
MALGQIDLKKFVGQRAAAPGGQGAGALGPLG